MASPSRAERETHGPREDTLGAQPAMWSGRWAWCWHWSPASEPGSPAQLPLVALDQPFLSGPQFPYLCKEDAGSLGPGAACEMPVSCSSCPAAASPLAQLAPRLSQPPQHCPGQVQGCRD